VTRLAMAGTVVLFGAGLWLVVAPFAVGYQPRGHSWTASTLSDVAVGAVLIIAASGAFFTALAGAVRELYDRSGEH
jgi:hypothetical protein